MALSAKMDGKDFRTFVLMGDGEQDEGSIWEAAMFSASRKLDNLYAIVDRNHLQISGPTEDIIRLEPLKANGKLSVFMSSPSTATTWAAFWTPSISCLQSKVSPSCCWRARSRERASPT
jgi:hypothetical protein